MRLYTIGHSNRSAERVLEMLRENGVTAVADVRGIPRSRHNPQFNREGFEATLAEAGIEYRHLEALGGRRNKQVERSPNGFWVNAQFRNYADYALSHEFRAGLEELEALAAERPTAVMCAEAVWWRCHRRIVTDHLLARGHEVGHIMDAGKAEPASMTPQAQVRDDGAVVYPPEQGQLL